MHSVPLPNALIQTARIGSGTERQSTWASCGPAASVWLSCLVGRKGLLGNLSEPTASHVNATEPLCPIHMKVYRSGGMQFPALFKDCLTPQGQLSYPVSARTLQGRRVHFTTLPSALNQTARIGSGMRKHSALASCRPAASV